MNANLAASRLAARYGSFSYLIGCVALYNVSTLMFWLTPQILFGAVARYNVSNAQAGLIAFVELMALSVGLSALGARPPRFTHRQLAAFGMLLLVAGNLASSWMPNLLSLVVLRGVMGLAAAILSFVVVSLISMHSTNPDRNFSILMVCTILFGSMTLSLPSYLKLDVHGLAFFSFAALVIFFMLPFVTLIPKGSRTGLPVKGSREAESKTRLGQKFIVSLIIVITLVVSFVPFMVFTYFPAIGLGLNMAQSTIDRTLGVATIAAIAGPVTATVSVRWLGRWWSMFGIAFLMAVGCIIVTSTSNQALVGPSLMAALACTYFASPILLGWSAEIDNSGRAATLTMGTLGLASAVTPSLAGGFVDYFGLAVLPYIATIGSLIAIGSILMLRMPILRRSS